jgi:hypothetical protein
MYLSHVIASLSIKLNDSMIFASLTKPPRAPLAVTGAPLANPKNLREFSMALVAVYSFFS